MAQPFDPDRLEMRGVPVRVAERVQYSAAIGGYGAFSVSQNNTIVYRAGSGSRSVLAWFDRTGKQLGQVGAAGAYLAPSLSPDGSKVVATMTAENGNNDIWLLDAIRNASSRLTFEGTAVIPIWSPDGNRILYRSGQAGSGGDLYEKLSSGAGTPEALFKSNTLKNPTDWSADGHFVVYDAPDFKTGVDVWVLPTTGDRKPFPMLRSEFNEQQGRVSPDGQWIAYTSDETGRPEVYVQSFPTPGGKWPISTSGGADPRWRRDGKELFFISSDRKLMAVDIQAESTFQAGLPRPLFDVRVSGLTDVRTHYAVAADGRRFLVNTIDETDVAAPITVVLNWTARLKQ
jgi:Tol biopolymer transport system component